MVDNQLIDDSDEFYSPSFRLFDSNRFTVLVDSPFSPLVWPAEPERSSAYRCCLIIIARHVKIGFRSNKKMTN